MLSLITLLLTALTFLSSVHGHMALQYPPQFRAAWNPTADQNTIDYTPTAPLSGSAAFPCKQYHVGITDKDSTATWNAGGSYNMTVKGSAAHGGGSCQVSLSYDSGKTFRVIHSYIGSCPTGDGEAFDFTVPSDAPAGLAIFAWTWLNKIGNREFYMACSAVTITGGSKRQAPAVAFSSRPEIFVANLGNGCTSAEGTDVVFPSPGPSEDVTIKGSSAASGFSGTCSGSGSGSEGSPPASPSYSAPASSAPASSQAPATSQPATASSNPSSGFATSTSSAPTSTGTGTPSTLTPSPDGSCGAESGHTCSTGNCCSPSNFCGSSDQHCGTGCQAGFGQCGAFLNVSGRATVASVGRLFPVGVAGRHRV